MNLRNFFVVALSTASFALSAGDTKTPPGDFYDEVSRLNKVLSEVNRKYVEDVNPTELTDAALNGAYCNTDVILSQILWGCRALKSI